MCKTDVKKIVRKPIPIKYPYYINEEEEMSLDNILSDMSEEGENYFFKCVVSNEKRYNIAFTIQSSSSCCGVRELEDICFAFSPPENIMLEVVNIMIIANPEVTFVVYTNGEHETQAWEIAFAKSKHWTLVKTFPSCSNTNTLKMWVSNN